MNVKMVGCNHCIVPNAPLSITVTDSEVIHSANFIRNLLLKSNLAVSIINSTFLETNSIIRLDLHDGAYDVSVALENSSCAGGTNFMKRQKPSHRRQCPR